MPGGSVRAGGSVRIQWSGDREVRLRMDQYGRDVSRTIHRVAQYWQPVLEAYAKDHAPWTDRTGNARQSLHTFIEELSADTVALYLAHGVDYGVHLETMGAGKYSIIAPTLRAHYSQIADMLRGIFGR